MTQGTLLVLAVCTLSIGSGRAMAGSSVDTAREQAPSAHPCPALIEESADAIRVAKAALFPRDGNNAFDRAFDIELERAFVPERLCAEGAGGAWAIVFEKSTRIDMPDDPRGTESVMAWKLVHVDRRGARVEIGGTNQFAGVTGLPFTLRDGAATVAFGPLVVPRLLTGDFDGTGREQAIVMTEWPRDPTAEPDPEYDERTFHWPHERALGVAYILRDGRIERRPGLADSWITSARRVDATGEWQLKTYGPFFQFASAHAHDISEAGYPVFGPEFTVFRGGSDGLTLDDPRQVPLLRAQCAKLVSACEDLLAAEDVAIFDAVCERVPGAPLPRKNKWHASSIAGAQRVRPAAWLDRFRRIPVPGVPWRTQRKPKPYRARFLWEYPLEVQRSTCTWEPLPRRAENE